MISISTNVALCLLKIDFVQKCFSDEIKPTQQLEETFSSTS